MSKEMQRGKKKLIGERGISNHESWGIRKNMAPCHLDTKSSRLSLGAYKKQYRSIHWRSAWNTCLDYARDWVLGTKWGLLGNRAQHSMTLLGKILKLGVFFATIMARRNGGAMAATSYNRKCEWTNSHYSNYSGHFIIAPLICYQ